MITAWVSCGRTNAALQTCDPVGPPRLTDIAHVFVQTAGAACLPRPAESDLDVSSLDMARHSRGLLCFLSSEMVTSCCSDDNDDDVLGENPLGDHDDKGGAN